MHQADPVYGRGSLILVVRATVEFSYKKTTLSIISTAEQEGGSHKSLSLQFQIKARPHLWCDQWYQAGASCGLLYSKELAEFLLQPRGACSTTQPAGHAGYAHSPALQFLR